jgi:hypothetical protein
MDYRLSFGDTFVIELTEVLFEQRKAFGKPALSYRDNPLV